MSSQSRVDMLALTDARERAAQCGIPDAMAELSVFRIALHQPPVAVALHGMLEALLWKGALDARLRELIIMRIGWVTVVPPKSWRVSYAASGLVLDSLIS